MKGIIYMPSQTRKYTTDRYNVLFEMLHSSHGFSLEYNNTPIPDCDTDIVINYAGPQHSWPNAMSSLVNLPTRTKLIYYMGDPWFSNTKEKRNVILRETMPKMLDRADIVLSACDQIIDEMWSAWKEKFVWFPNFFAPVERFALPIREIQDTIYNKVLIIGRLSERAYPIRTFVRNNLDQSMKHVVKHPGCHPDMVEAEKRGLAVLGNYSRTINRFFATVTCATHWKVMVTKYPEIAASGSLLIAEDCPDVRKAGWIPGENFVAINMKNSLQVIKRVIASPEKYNDIRMRGVTHARSTLGVDKRFEQISDIISNMEKHNDTSK